MSLNMQIPNMENLSIEESSQGYVNAFQQIASGATTNDHSNWT